MATETREDGTTINYIDEFTKEWVEKQLLDLIEPMKAIKRDRTVQSNLIDAKVKEFDGSLEEIKDIKEALKTVSFGVAQIRKELDALKERIPENLKGKLTRVTDKAFEKPSSVVEANLKSKPKKDKVESIDLKDIVSLEPLYEAEKKPKKKKKKKGNKK